MPLLNENAGKESKETTTTLSACHLVQTLFSQSIGQTVLPSAQRAFNNAKNACDLGFVVHPGDEGRVKKTMKGSPLIRPYVPQNTRYVAPTFYSQMKDARNTCLSEGEDIQTCEEVMNSLMVSLYGTLTPK